VSKLNIGSSIPYDRTITVILLDTDILIEILRNQAPAVNWLQTLGADPIGVPGLVAMELLQGCRNRIEQRQVERFLRPYPLYWPSEDDCLRAFLSFAKYHLSHSLGLLDALIGETAIGYRAELATFNLKHYQVLPGLAILQPYKR
jgi:predicted nucleic acid-binding protein